MSYSRIIFLLFVFFTGHIQQASAQSSVINGDTVFVNREAEVQIVFPTVPKQFSTLPENSAYRIWEVRNGIYLIAGSETNEPVTLSVTEAERNHRFILIFKKDLDNTNAKLYYDYSTIKKLEQHIRLIPPRPIAPEKTIVKTEPVVQDAINEKAAITVAAPVDNSLMYYAILAQGDKDLKLQNYQAAMVSFNKAHSLRPDDKFPIERLEEIKSKLAEKAKSSPVDINKEYKAVTAGAVKYLDQRKYAEAQEAYQHALELKPGDAFATSQLQTLNTYLLRVNNLKEPQKIKDLNAGKIAQTENVITQKQLSDEDYYNTAVKSADDFFKAGNYDSARAAYNKALGILNRDWPKDQITKIDRMQSDQIVQANAEKEKLKQQQEQIAQANAEKEKLKQQQDQIAQANAEKEKLKQQQDRIAQANADKEKLKQQQEQVAQANAEKEKLKQEQDQIKINNDRIAQENADKVNLKQQPINQSIIIDANLEDSANLSETDIAYEQSIHFADSLTNFKAFDSAVIAYRQASAIKPLESYPRKQLRYLQSELAQIAKKIAKQKREDEERRHADAITRADKAVSDKNYVEAKSTYTEALSIHPDNEYAQRRLEIITYQIEKANAEKLRQDSLNSIIQVPVKKPGRKRSR